MYGTVPHAHGPTPASPAPEPQCCACVPRVNRTKDFSRPFWVNLTLVRTMLTHHELWLESYPVTPRFAGRPAAKVNRQTSLWTGRGGDLTTSDDACLTLGATKRLVRDDRKPVALRAELSAGCVFAYAGGVESTRPYVTSTHPAALVCVAQVHPPKT